MRISGSRGRIRGMSCGRSLGRRSGMLSSVLMLCDGLSRYICRVRLIGIGCERVGLMLDLAGALKGYTLVAHRSGHTLGGSLYTLRPSLSSSLSPASSSSSLLYAPIFNHIKEHHLDGAALLNGAKIDEAMRRMGVVVVGADRSLTINVKRIDRERALLGSSSPSSLPFPH